MTATPVQPGPAPSRRFGWIAFWVVVALVALVHFGLPRWQGYVESVGSWTVGSWEVKAGPVVATDAGGALVVATVVVQERTNWSRPTRRSYADDYIVELQLNHPDGSDAGRVFVHRSEASVLNLSVLGVMPDRVWLFTEGLRSVRLAERVLDVEPETIAARVPALAGQLSDDERHYTLNGDGSVTLLARDGRRFALRASDWSVAPAPTPTPIAQAKDMDEYRRQVAEYDRRMLEVTGPRLASVAGEFGLDSWQSDGRWIGVLSDTEHAKLERSWAHPRVASWSDPERRRLWLADTTTRVDEAIDLDTFLLADVRPAGERAYLRGSVLRDGHELRAVTVPGSPDVLIQHYDAIDDRAAFALTRIAPDGAERWTTTMPIRFPRTVASAGDYVVLSGLPPGSTDERQLLLVSVRLVDGVVATYAYGG